MDDIGLYFLTQPPVRLNFKKKENRFLASTAQFRKHFLYDLPASVDLIWIIKRKKLIIFLSCCTHWYIIQCFVLLLCPLLIIKIKILNFSLEFPWFLFVVVWNELHPSAPTQWREEFKKEKCFSCQPQWAIRCFQILYSVDSDFYRFFFVCNVK